MSRNLRMTYIVCAIVAALFLTQTIAFIPKDDPIMRSSASDDSLMLMVYMSADVAGSPLNWSEDLNEMENGLRNDNLTVLALIDPEGTGDTKLYLVKEDLGKSEEIVSSEIADPPFVPSDNESNMGNPATLVGFANYCIENQYSGGKIGLIIWGHGGGWAGVAVDKSDYLSSSELVFALQEIKDALSRPIDLIAFDACSMGSIEILSELSGLASLAVTSEIEIPASGFPYETILSRISSDLSISTFDIAFSIADEYVKFGTLMTDTTSQAAVIDLSDFENASDSIREFSEVSIFFDPVCRELFNETRNSSTSILPIGSIDTLDYLSKLRENADIPRKLVRYAMNVTETISKSILRNRVHVSEADLQIMHPDSLKGISIYYPVIPVILDEYEQTGRLSEHWSVFLNVVMSASYHQLPTPNIGLDCRDLKYSDGLNDSFELNWTETGEIAEWEFEVYREGEFVPILTISRDDDNGSAIINTCDAGIYDIFAYGRDTNGIYLNWEKFEDRILFKLIGIVVLIPTSIDIAGTELKIRNLRTNEIEYFNVEERNMILKFAIPVPNEMGDRMLIELYKNSTLLASGLLIFDGSTPQVQLYENPYPSATVIFLAVITASFQVVFAMMRLLRNENKD